MDPVQESIVQQLQQFSTCDVSDALLKLGVPHCGFVPGLTMWSPQRQAGETSIVGTAYTVKYVPLYDMTSPKLTSHYIDSVKPGTVIFITAPKTANCAYGGMMSIRAHVSGAVRAVVDGNVRDLNEHRKLGFPVFARDTGTAPPYEVMRVSEINVPIKIQGEHFETVVNPGDYIIGDVNGVVCLPAYLAERVLPMIRAGCEADIKVGVDIKAGIPFVEASRTHRAK